MPTPRTPLAPADVQALRYAMRQVPAPVAVVTAARGAQKRGVTISSLTSVSLDPSLISFNIGRASRMYGVLAGSECFAVHILGEHQVWLAQHFAAPGRTSLEQFETISHRCNGDGIPVLPEALITMNCASHALHDAGDHIIVVGRVLQVHADRASRPLLYVDRSYCGVGPALG